MPVSQPLINLNVGFKYRVGVWFDNKKSKIYSRVILQQDIFEDILVHNSAVVPKVMSLNFWASNLKMTCLAALCS